MGRPCLCCKSKEKYIAYIGVPLAIFTQGIYTDYPIAFNDFYNDGSTFKDNFKDFISEKPLAYKYVPFDLNEYDKYEGITIGTAVCGAVYMSSDIINAIKKFIAEKNKNNFIFWHSEWNNFDFEEETWQCFNQTSADTYTQYANQIGLNVVFKSSTSSPQEPPFSPDYGYLTLDTSVPFLSIFTKPKTFNTAATGKCDNIQPIAWAQSIFKHNGEAIYYEVTSTQVKIVIVADSNFCALSALYPNLNPLFARALIERAGY